MYITVSIYPKERLQHCTDRTREIYIMIRRIIFSKGRANMRETLWKMKYDKFQWTKLEMPNAEFVQLYIAVKVNKKTIYKNDTLTVDHVNTVSQPTGHNCEEVMRVEYHYEMRNLNSNFSEMKKQHNATFMYFHFNEVLQPMKKPNNDTSNIFCVLSTCYSLHKNLTYENMSWNDADIFCQKQNKQLLTINYETTDYFLMRLLSLSQDMYFHVIFLNMQQDNKVSDMVN